MKKLLVLVVMALFVVSTYADDKQKKVTEVTYKVEMDCQSCVNKITKNMPFEKGVKDLKVDFEGQTVTVKYREDKTTKENLVKAFEKLEFEVEELKDGECVNPKAKCCEGHHH
ncbi:heavy-metal-associated domain-containing protein [Carboxylicivirga mesophila]|uniref:Heavy-metal-associated domain-containing protein n=1 Tax=Carboxylicivirga mesophila TaxID=1166478 RepID=A0ABS5KF71_9BACT|nr:heavy-metal-associated domain-containing protein [Carboxylicivirga mesophila]MBS2213166.1 heavy-metal-associated domain-containing protein [Carboxylicivirga mesophila]